MTKITKAKKKRIEAAVPLAEPVLLKLDFGCGPNPAPGFEGVDILPFDGKVKHVRDLRMAGEWIWGNETVDEARSSHFVEHLTGAERVVFFNQLYRVLKPNAKFEMVVPHWSNDRAYGDPTHQWPPMSEWFTFYLSRAWREGVKNEQGVWTMPPNAPHTGFTCNFAATWGYTLEPELAARGLEYQQYAAKHLRNAIQDMICTLTKVT